MALYLIFLKSLTRVWCSGIFFISSQSRSEMQKICTKPHKTYIYKRTTDENQTIHSFTHLYQVTCPIKQKYKRSNDRQKTEKKHTTTKNKKILNIKMSKDWHKTQSLHNIQVGRSVCRSVGLLTVISHKCGDIAPERSQVTIIKIFKFWHMNMNQ